ncbi:MAG: hypothetical protein R3354_07635, partial [Thiohalomonadales bacterium]|nr:hypothetical protein [Thiohalomonadales bacterium]
MSIEEIWQYIQEFDREKIWIVYIFAIIFVALLVDMVQKIVLGKLQKRLTSTTNVWDDALVHAIRKPLSLLIWIIGLTMALQVMEFKPANVVRDVGVILVATWALIRFITFTEKNILHKHEIAGKELDRTTADAITQLLRITVL